MYAKAMIMIPTQELDPFEMIWQTQENLQWRIQRGSNQGSIGRAKF